MEYSKHLERIDQLILQLKNKGAKGTEQYRKKLIDNAKSDNKFDDLLYEGQSSLMFLENGFEVTLRESPDLMLVLDSEVVYAEVKHFKEKKQDGIDDKAMTGKMLGPYQLMVPIHDILATEGSNPWDQIVSVAISKTNQYIENAANILIIESDSDCLSLKLATAAHLLNDQAKKTNDVRLRRLNALMLVNCGLVDVRNFSNTEFCYLDHPETQMSRKMIDKLFDIRFG